MRKASVSAEAAPVQTVAPPSVHVAPPPPPAPPSTVARAKVPAVTVPKPLPTATTTVTSPVLATTMLPVSSPVTTSPELSTSTAVARTTEKAHAAVSPLVLPVSTKDDSGVRTWPYLILLIAVACMIALAAERHFLMVPKRAELAGSPAK